MVRVTEALYSVPLLFMRRVYTKCYRYINDYRIGINDRQVEFATKNYTYHRSIPPAYIWRIRKFGFFVKQINGSNYLKNAVFLQKFDQMMFNSGANVLYEK